MNFHKILKLLNRGCINWRRLVLVSSLGAFGINLTPFSTQAHSTDQTLSLTSQSTPTGATFQNQLFAQTPRIDQTDIPRTIPSKPQLPQAPQSPTPSPIQTPPASEVPQQRQETIPYALKPECEIPELKSQVKQKGNSNLVRLLTQNQNTRPTLPHTVSDSSGNVISQQNNNDDAIVVKQFKVRGSTIFGCKELENTLKNYLGKSLSFVELLEARSAITKMYTDKKYTTTGAYIPAEQKNVDDKGAIIIIQVVEGKVEEIKVRGTKRLNPNYVRSRLRLGASTPLNEDKLLDALKLLQVNPLINNISAELRAGVRPGTNVLEVSVEEANTWSGQIFINNGRSPSIGSFRRGANITQANLLGLGDALSVGYNNTDGSNGYDLSYTLPLNPKNGRLEFNYGSTSGNIIETPFNRLDIDSNSRYYQLTFRQPIIQTSSQEFSLSLTASRNENQTFLRGKPFPVSTGSDREGRTQVSAIRFAQEWVKQNRRQVFAARSQFSWGLDAFDATINNNNDPDSRFFSWRGQLYFIQLFGLNTGNLPTAPTFSIRTDVQLADRPLLSAEQVGLGGFGSIRGYRQDALLADNGVIANAEFRFPIVTIPKQAALLLIPFIDVGTAWNSSNIKLPDNTLASVGLGLQLVTPGNFSARIDWGIPLVNLDSSKKTWQENGIYFSVQYNPF